jgi:hypothetical protein
MQNFASLQRDPNRHSGTMNHKNCPHIAIFFYFYPMKTFVKLSLTIFLFTIVSCKPSPQKAQDYYTDITKPIESVLTKEDALIQVINADMNKDSAKSNSVIKEQDKTEMSVKHKALDMAFANFQLQIATALNQMKAIGKFDNGSALHDAALVMLTEYKAVSENEYPALISIVKISDEAYTNEDDTRFFVLSDSIDNKLQQKISAYIQQVKLFSQEYNFQLENDTLK